MQNLYDRLMELHDGDLYPLHMPGHKRLPGFLPDTARGLAGAYAVDTTETKETDALYEASGILALAQERANRLYGEGREDTETFFLTGGATQGVLSALHATTCVGDTVVALRNAHRSMYHALLLKHLQASYVMPPLLTDGFYGALSPDEVAAKLRETPEARAVFLTSPTYEGVVSDVALTAVIAHSHGIPLIVDEAHGAHLGLHEGLPRGALSQGADIVIHSLHKTLASLTQTALIHVQGDIVDRERFRKSIAVFGSSSPSYVLMSAIDLCIGDLENNGRRRFEKLLRMKAQLLQETAMLTTLQVVDESIVQDPAKAVIMTPYLCGQALADILRERYHLVCEMVQDSYVVCILTPYDTESVVSRLTDALYGADELFKSMQGLYGTEEIYLPPVTDGRSAAFRTQEVFDTLPQAVLSIGDAFDAPAETVHFSQAEGRVSADFIDAYPPGIPLIVPGEVFSPALVQYIAYRLARGRALRGVDADGFLRCL